MRADRSPRLGDELLRAGAITPEQLDAALAHQREDGSRLGHMLQTSGDATRLDVYAALAETWGIPLVDLIIYPPDPELLERVGPERMLAEHWVPHRVEQLQIDADGASRRTLVIATSEPPTDDLASEALELVGGDRVRFEATTDWDIDQAVLRGCEQAIVDEAAEGLADRTPDQSARTGWKQAPWQVVVSVILLVVLIVAAILSTELTILAVLLGLNLMFFAGSIFKIGACISGIFHLRKLEREGDPRANDIDGPVALVPRLADHELPRFTILVPAYHEANVVGKLIENLSALDYPASKLQVLLLMEPDDVETIAAAKRARPPDYVRFVVVPAGGPQTKPKACNVGLALANGEYLVIYDAEDRPEPGQLREVVARFTEASDDVACFQARLNYFNASENILTRMFTLEYSFWFDYMLPGLDAWNLPIPLGGTSNHFRVDSLRALGGWDPYNVTEDADLGVRASAQGRTVGITRSTTWEEACSETRAWIRQRTRWIKGYMVTALVHLRHPKRLWNETGTRGVVGVVGLIAGTPAMFLACPVVWAFWLYSFLGGSIPGVHLPEWVQLTTDWNLVISNGAMIVLTAFAAWRRKAYGLIPFALLNPAYWILHSVAAWRALFQLVLSPFHWEKTPHGIEHGAHAPRVAAASVASADDRPSNPISWQLPQQDVSWRS
jgi:cellulose synthase/poly-beta-1,6-N-acetylglucosamine synthase-like glycosyltransferase